MAQIYNTELQKALILAGKLATARDNIPNQLAEKVVPTMEVNPFLTKNSEICLSGTAINSTATTLTTLQAGKDFYLTGATISMIKDATATSTLSAIYVVIGGLSTAIFRIPGITLTPQAQSLSISLARPLKIDRGSAITLSNSTNVANVATSGSITGFYDESALA